MDRYSPLAPAFVRVLVLPVGQIDKKRFLAVVDGLRQEASVIQLEDVAPRVGEEELLLSPKGFPQGCLLYNYTTSVPSEHHHQLSPYELFREPLLVIGVVDGLGDGALSGLTELSEASRYLREKHQRVVARQSLVIEKDEQTAATADNVVHVAEAAVEDARLLKDAVLELSARFLSELSTYTRALQASPSIQTPGQTARSLQRPISSRDNDKPPPSGQTTPTQASEAGSPIDASGVRTPPYGRSSPATSFEQIASNAQNALSRSESRANRGRHAGRASSQDRVSAQGFGSMSQEKLKNRGKARVGIVTGHLYMMAGQWGEGLKILVDGTHKARTLNDYLWHAKGMEGIVICLLLHAWAGIEFSIPTICYPLTDRMASGHSQRFSINHPSDFRTAEAAQKAAVHKFSNYLPDLIKQILNLYDSGEASLELPYLVISEATVRFCKLLVVLQRTGELNKEALKQLMDDPGSSILSMSKPPATTATAQKISHNVIASMLAEAQPLEDDNVPIPDQVSILAGIASVYTTLNMKRKRATAMRETVIKLTYALSQARKRGAAEVGIHPAATLSAENGAEAILAATALSGGLHQMLQDVATSYGVPSLDAPTGAMSALVADVSGNESLKRLVLTELSAFCEASPDLQGLLRVNTALLRGANAKGVGDSNYIGSESLSREVQIRLTSTIIRSVGVSKHLGLPKLEAAYWDSFLVRDVSFVPPDKDHRVLNRTELNGGPAVPSQQSASNPLLYDPNASRPGTAASLKPMPFLLVQSEAAECIVKLQNPYEVAVEIESITLVTEGVELSGAPHPITLGPSRLQEVSLAVEAKSTGDCKITACCIKVSGCAEQEFPIFEQPWAAPTPLLIKNIGQEAGVLAIDKASPPAQKTVEANIIEALPLLALQRTSLIDDGLMLLDGESASIEIILENKSSTPAVIVEFATTNSILTAQEDVGGTTIPVGESKRVKLHLHGKAGVARVQATLLYGRSGDERADQTNVRVLTVPIEVTVHASLQLQNLEILPAEPTTNNADALTLSLDIGNAWPQSLQYTCAVSDEGLPDAASDNAKAHGTLAPGQIHRIFLPLRRPTLPHDASLERLRAALLSRLSGTWNGDNRKGNIEFSKLRPSADVLDVIRNEPIDLQLEVVGGDDDFSHSLADATVKAGSFLTVRTRLRSNGALAAPLVVNLQPRAQGHSQNGNADAGMDERRYAVSGARHRVLTPLADGKETYVDFAICPLLAGRLDLDATVRPAQMLRAVRKEKEGWMVRKTLRMRVV